MRLGLVLFKWPKVRPPGNIWSGWVFLLFYILIKPYEFVTSRKNQMVRKVQPHHKRQIQEDIDREKTNIFLCMHPAATVVTIPAWYCNEWMYNVLLILQEQERILYEQLDKEEDPKTTLLKLHKAGEEATNFAPIPLNGHYNSLNRIGTWQKYWN